MSILTSYYRSVSICTDIHHLIVTVGFFYLLGRLLYPNGAHIELEHRKISINLHGHHLHFNNPEINTVLVVMMEVLFLMGNIKGKEERESNVLMMYYNTWFP